MIIIPLTTLDTGDGSHGSINRATNASLVVDILLMLMKRSRFF